jgi:hypothetical protein
MPGKTTSAKTGKNKSQKETKQKKSSLNFRTMTTPLLFTLGTHYEIPHFGDAGNLHMG